MLSEIDGVSYRALRDRPANWVIDTPGLMERVLVAAYIQRALEFAARNVCNYCHQGVARKWRTLYADDKPDAPKAWYHEMTLQDYLNHYGMYDEDSAPRYSEQHPIRYCAANAFIDGPKPGEGWYK